MSTRWKSMRRRDGSALFTVMLLVMVIASLLGLAYKSSVQRVFMARKLTDSVRAVSLAEAGAHKAFSMLQTNFAARSRPELFPLTSFGGGTYDVEVTPVGTTLAVVKSRGVYGYAQEDVMLDVRDLGSDPNSPANSVALDYSILCGGRFDFGGCGTISSTNGHAVLHANGQVIVRGDAQVNLDIRSSTRIDLSNGVDINGSVTAPILSYTASKVTLTEGAITQAVAYVPIPDIDFTPYYTWALEHGEVKNGWNMSGGTYTANGGVIWVNGDVQLSSSTIIHGTILATGKIKLAGSTTVYCGPSGIAAASRDGDIDYQTGGVTYGLVYCKTGSFTQTSNGRIEGQLIIKGNIDKGGTSDDMLYVKTILTPPGDAYYNGHIIDVSAWQR